MLTRLCLSFALAGALLLGASGASAYNNAVACGNWTVGGIDLACAGPASSDSSYHGSAVWPGWAVLAITPGADVTFSGGSTGDGGTGSGGPPTPTGNLGLYGSNVAAVTGTAKIAGNVYDTGPLYGAPVTDTSGTIGSLTQSDILSPYGFVSNFATDTLLYRARQDAVAAATAASALTTTVPLANIVNSDGTPSGAAFTSLASSITLGQDITIKASKNGTNVINFGGDLALGSYKLTLNGNGFTNVDFVLNIGKACSVSTCGDLTGNGSSAIVLAGGIAWSDVLINVRDDVTITSDSTTVNNRYSGILLAGATANSTNGIASAISMDKTQWTGEVIGAGDMAFTSGAQITNPGGLISMISYAPAPGTLWLLLLAGTLGAASRAFRLSCGKPRAVQPC